MKAVVMAGGEGTRLRPLTSNQPKPMVPVFNRPIMEYIIELLKKHNIKNIVVTLQFMPQLIKNYFGDGSDLGVNLIYAVEQQPLGTAGSVKNAEEHLNETFVVISGDALTDINLTELIAFHKQKHSLATIALKRVENPLEFGIVIVDEVGQVQRFLEKPTWGEVFSDTINTGIYVLEPEIFQYIPANKMVDFAKDVFPKLLKAKKPLYGYVFDGYWCDVGNYEQYMQAHQDLLSGAANINLSGLKMKENIWLGEGAYIHPEADITGPAYIGQNARIERGAEIDEFSVIGNNVVVEANSHIHRAIVWDNSYISSQVFLHGCVIGKNCDLKDGVRVEQGVVIGDDCRIGAGAIINPEVKIYPYKTVDQGATINTSIIWETRGTRHLFGVEGISGLIGVDITPELALRVAMAYGTSLPKGSEVIVTGDVSRASRMIKRAIIAGLNSTGIHCRDLRVAPAPVNRFNIHTSGALGGIHIKVSPFNPQIIQLAFFNNQGIDIKESEQSNIERYFYRGEFRRVHYSDIGRIDYSARSKEYYINGLLKATQPSLIAKHNFKVVLDYSFGSASLTFPAFLGALGCQVLALNSYTDEYRLTVAESSLEARLAQLAQTVKLFQANFGLLIDSAGEKVHLVDDKGKPLEPTELLLLLALLVCRQGKKGKLAVPISVPTAIDSIASRYQRLILRTKATPQALMQASNNTDVIFAGAQGGGFIFSHFLPAYDAAMTFCQLLEFLALEGKPVSEIRLEIPATNLAQQTVYCPWENKGLVMRRLIEKAKNKNIELLDGIKIYENHNAWVLAVPDPSEPFFKIFAEAESQAKVKGLVAAMAKEIETILKQGHA